MSNLERVDEEILTEERACVKTMAGKRRREFAAGRVGARKALAQAGVRHWPLLKGAQGEPLWPPGIVGSISHCDVYCAVAVASTASVQGLGLDLERTDELQEELWPWFCTRSELERIRRLPSGQRQEHAALIFSAKECMYKYQYPLTRHWLDFPDVVIHLDERCQRFEACLEPAGQGGGPVHYGGRFAVWGQYVITALAIKPAGRTPAP